MSLAELANEANKLEDEIGIPLDAVMHKLTQEVGELNDAIQTYRGVYSKDHHDKDLKIRAEAGDLMLNLISILNRLGIDPDELDELAGKTLEKFKTRKELYKN